MQKEEAIEQLKNELATARERIAALESRDQQLTDFIENAAVGLHWVGADGTILWANQAELDLLGYTKEEYIGRHIAEFHADQSVINDILARLTANETLHGYEASLRCKDGSIRTVLISSNVLRQDGKFVHTRCFTRDITDRKKIELQLQEQTRIAEEANRIKDEFLAMVSHELRTPLTSMLGWVRLLRTGGLDGAAAARAFETIERNVKSQAQLIEDLLDVSRIMSGKLRFETRPVELDAIINVALDTLRPSAQTKNIQILISMDSMTGSVLGDPERLQQVIWNLLSNAIKFTPKDGQIVVELKRIGSNIELTVTDTGEGIEPELLSFIFNRFAQADTSINRTHKGLGLGLTIAKHIVELHGGTIKAVSKGKGQGASFRVQLPVMTAPPALAAVEANYLSKINTAAFAPIPELVGLRILVVDDEPDTADLIKTIFEQCQAEVRTANNVKQALAIFDEWSPNLLLSDIGMPGQNGYQLIRQIRERGPERNGKIPAVALTAFARVEDRMKVLAAGFQMHVSKPVEPNELITIVASLTNVIG